MKKVTINDLPIVVAKNRTQTLGGVKSGQETLQADVMTQALSDIPNLVREITYAEIELQERAGNEPSAIAVDNSPTKKVKDAQKKTEVNFGSFMQIALINTIEVEVSKAIKNRTDSGRKGATGALQDTAHNWKWFYSADRQSAWTPVNPRSLSSISIDARLAFAPDVSKIGYAGFASVIQRGSTGRSYEVVKGRSAKRQLPSFMGLASQKLSRMSKFKNAFTVYAVYSKSPALGAASTKYKFGVPCLILRPRITKRGRSRRR